MGESTSRSFNLLRYFTTASLGIVIAAALGIAFLSARVVRNSFVAMETDEADSLSEDLVGLLDGFHFGPAAWGRSAVPPEAARAAEREMQNFGIVDFTLFATDGTLLHEFSTRPGPPRPAWDEGRRAAAAGDERLRWDVAPWWSRGGPGWIETYTAVRDGGQVVAVARVRRDLSPVVAAAHAILPDLFALSLLVGFALFFALWLLVRKADRILAAQQHDLHLARQELLAKNEVLAQLNRRKDEFYAICCGELREPLLALQHHSADLRQSKARPLPLSERRTVDAILQNAETAMHLLEELVELAQFESGADEVQVALEDATAIVDEAVAATRVVAAARGVALEVRALPQPVPVQVDRRRLVRALVQLLSSAIRNSPAGLVVVNVAAQGGRVLIAVTDQGPALAAEDLARVFEPGAPLVAGREGLFQVRQIVERLGGELDLLSREGFGATVTVTLPGAPVTPEPDERDVAARLDAPAPPA